MKSFKGKILELSKRFQFTQGMALGLTISSFLAYGVVNITSFTPGTTIESAAVNANFQALKGAIENLQIKQIGSFTSAFSVNCVSSPSYPVDYIDVEFQVENDLTGATVQAQDTFTIPETGFYQIIHNLPGITSAPTTYLNINGTGSNAGVDGNIIRKLNTNDYVKFQASCPSYLGASVNFASKGVVVIKKL